MATAKQELEAAALVQKAEAKPGATDSAIKQQLSAEATAEKAAKDLSDLLTRAADKDKSSMVLSMTNTGPRKAPTICR